MNTTKNQPDVNIDKSPSSHIPDPIWRVMKRRKIANPDHILETKPDGNIFTIDDSRIEPANRVVKVSFNPNQLIWHRACLLLITLKEIGHGTIQWYIERSAFFSPLVNHSRDDKNVWTNTSNTWIGQIVESILNSKFNHNIITRQGAINPKGNPVNADDCIFIDANQKTSTYDEVLIRLLDAVEAWDERRLTGKADPTPPKPDTDSTAKAEKVAETTNRPPEINVSFDWGYNGGTINGIGALPLRRDDVKAVIKSLLPGASYEAIDELATRIQSTVEAAATNPSADAKAIADLTERLEKERITNRILNARLTAINDTSDRWFMAAYRRGKLLEEIFPLFIEGEENRIMSESKAAIETAEKVALTESEPYRPEA